MWRKYLLGRKFELRNNHMRLKYLLDQIILNARQAKFLEFLCKFEFEIKHVKGKENKVVDSLSKIVYVASMSIFNYDLRENIISVTTKYEKYIKVTVSL